MSVFYQYPPTGSSVGSAALPAAGLNLDFSFRHGKPTNITAVCVSGTPVLQYWDAKDNPSIPTTIPAGQGFHDQNVTLQRFTVTGSGTVAVRLMNAPSDIDIQALLQVAVSGTVAVSSIAGTVNTDVGQGTAPNPNVSGTVAVSSVGGTVNTDVGQGTAPSPNVTSGSAVIVQQTQIAPIAFTNGATPPSLGFIKYIVKGTGAIPTLTIGGSGALDLNGGATLAASVLLIGSFPCTPTATYTVGGCTIEVLTFFPSVGGD